MREITRGLPDICGYKFRGARKKGVKESGRDGVYAVMCFLELGFLLKERGDMS